MTREEIFQNFQPLCRKLAWKYSKSNGGADYDDIFQVAQIGLLEAIDRLEDLQGPHAGYLEICINGQIKNHFKRNHYSGFSLAGRTAQVALKKCIPELREVGLTDENKNIVCEKYDVTRETLDSVIYATEGTRRTLDDRGYDGDDSDYNPLDAELAVEDDHSGFETKQLRKVIDRALWHLPRRERIIVRGYAIEGKSFEEIGEIVGFTGSRCGQLFAEAIPKLRRYLPAKEAFF